MNSFIENITRAINDFGDIKEAIQEKGVEVPEGTATSEYAGLVSGLVNPSEIPDPSDSLPQADGEAASGTSYDYARADHRHPSDPSKANLADIPTRVSQLTNDNGYVTSGELDDYVTLSEYETLVSRVEELERINSIPEQWKYIEFEVDSSDGTYIVPLSRYGENGLGYSLSIYVNGRHYGDYTGVVNYMTGTGVELTGLTGQTSRITLRPFGTVNVGWGRSFGYTDNLEGANSTVNKAKLLALLNDPDWAYLETATHTGLTFRFKQYYGCNRLAIAPPESMPDSVVNVSSNFRHSQYYGCASLIIAPTEKLPDSVTTIEGNFRYHQYNGCVSLTTAASEVMPDKVTSVGTYFRASQYYGCSSLISAPAEVFRDSVKTIGVYFRGNQYAYCTSLLLPPEEVFSDSISSVPEYFRIRQYFNCTSLRLAASEKMPDIITFVGRNFRADQYLGCESLITASVEVLPGSLTMIGDNFRYAQYRGCTNLISVPIEVLPDTVTSVGNYFRGLQFYECAAITETSPEIIPDGVTSIGGYFRFYQYARCLSLLIGNHIHDHRFQRLLNSDDYNFRYMFNLSSNKNDPDSVPKYYINASNTATAPITDLTPASDKYYLTNRTGIEGYQTIDSKWK